LTHCQETRPRSRADLADLADLAAFAASPATPVFVILYLEDPDALELANQFQPTLERRNAILPRCGQEKILETEPGKGKTTVMATKTTIQWSDSMNKDLDSKKICINRLLQKYYPYHPYLPSTRPTCWGRNYGRTR